MDIDKVKAEKILRLAEKNALEGKISPAWVAKIEHFSELCEAGTAKTHIAFFGTVVLAKAVDLSVDLYAIKPTHSPDNPKAWSARVLSEQILVPLSAELGINIGVTGRQPLNNQPYFRMRYLGDGTPVHSGGKTAYDYMISLVAELNHVNCEDEAILILGSFILVRKRYQVEYKNNEGSVQISPESLAMVIKTFVVENSESGKRAQAVAAGLVDIIYGTGRVESGRINDPSRKYPGDVCVRSAEFPDIWEKAIEVRDKPVSNSDILMFCNKCLSMGTREAAVLMVSDQQQPNDREQLNEWAHSKGLGLTLFYGWDSFVEQVLFWAEQPKQDCASQAVEYIHDRLVYIECPPTSVDQWHSLISESSTR